MMPSSRTLMRFLVLFLPFALGACGAFRVPYEPGKGAIACSHDTGNPRTIRVCPGDTLIGIGRDENVTVRGLMRANNLPDEKILVGQILTLPSETVHVVQPGDQVTGIARLYGVSVESIIAANELKRPYTIFPDQRLAVPQSGGVRVATSGGAARNLPTSPPVTDEAPTAPIIVNAPQPANQPEDMSNGGQQPAAVPATTASPAVTSPPAGGSGAVEAANAPIPRERPETARPATPKPVVVAKPTPAKSAAEPQFLLPVQGRIVSEFGPKSGGLHNDGINIAAPRGTPILATEAGTIAYAGDGLPGFGNLILIRHEDGWTSAYAHADSMDVKRGDKVTRGQTIGRVGSTGTVTEPQLHFELRKHDRAVDPKPLLGS